MSDGNRRKRPAVRIALAIAVAITAISLASLAVLHGSNEVSKYEREASEKYREYTAHTYGPKRHSCLKLPVLTQPDCVANAEREAREYERQEQDLVSQRVTAIWTMLMGGAAITGMLLSVLGVYLVWTTFQAAKEGNDISKNNGEAQVRAYVSLVDVEIHDYGDSTETSAKMYGGEHPTIIKLVFKNCGQSPSYNTVVRLQSRIVNKFTIDSLGYSLSDVKPTAPADMSAGQFFTRDASSVLSEEDYTLIVSGDYRHVIFGDIAYSDVFNKRQGPFRFRVVGMDLRTKDRRFVPF